jgi:hypothetical protein
MENGKWKMENGTRPIGEKAPAAKSGDGKMERWKGMNFGK